MLKNKQPVLVKNKTEAITVRLSPKLKYGLELLSRKQYRTLSSVVEWAVSRAINEEFEAYRSIDKLWDIEAADRLINLAFNYPELMTYEEQAIWKLIQGTGYVWKGNYSGNEWQWTVAENKVLLNRLRELWDKFQKISEGELSKDVLPKANKPAASFADDLDDDLPF